MLIMKARVINKVIREKMEDWIATLPEQLQAKVRKDTIVTGGCIASMLLKEEVNDFDLYLKTQQTAFDLAAHYVDKLVTDSPKDFECGIALYMNEPRFVPEDREADMDELPSSHYAVVRHPFSDRDREWAAKAMADGQVRNVAAFCKSVGFATDSGQEGYSYFEGHQTTADGAEYLEDQTDIDESGEKYRPVFISSNAITLSNKVQIVLRFTGSPDEIHENYDFVHATNVWTFDDGLQLKPEALEALLARELIYQGSKYPLASIFRLAMSCG